MKKIVVISAHPDDETLGCGGTLLKHKANGDSIAWIIVTSIFENQGYSRDIVEKRNHEIREVSAKYNFDTVYRLNYPTMSLSSSVLNTLIKDISRVFLEFKPEVIYVMNRSDAHSDHRIVFDATMACTKSFRYPFIKRVLMYECISETEFAPVLHEKVFLPNCYVDISKFIEKKLEIMQIFGSEIGDHPFPRSLQNIRSLASYRGAIAGVEYAEAFQLLLEIDK